MIGIGISVSGQEHVVRGLQQFSDDLRHDALKACAEAALASMLRRVEKGLDENDAPLKPIKRKGSTILWSTGDMIGAIGIQSVSGTRAVIGFGSGFAAQKAWWHQHGTKGPYPIRPKNGKALAFETSMSYANRILGRGRVTREDGTSYRKTRKFTEKTARANSRGMAVVRGVMHPGLPPRPFFGLSPRDERNVQAAADSWVKEHLPE